MTTLQEELLPTRFRDVDARGELVPSGSRPMTAAEIVGVPHTRTVVVGCACGGRLRIDRHAPRAGVANHNRTARHRAWRADEGL